MGYSWWFIWQWIFQSLQSLVECHLPLLSSKIIQAGIYTHATFTVITANRICWAALHGRLNIAEHSKKFCMEVEQEGALPILVITVVRDKDGNWTPWYSGNPPMLNSTFTLCPIIPVNINRFAGQTWTNTQKQNILHVYDHQITGRRKSHKDTEENCPLGFLKQSTRKLSYNGSA